MGLRIFEKLFAAARLSAATPTQRSGYKAILSEIRKLKRQQLRRDWAAGDILGEPVKGKRRAIRKKVRKFTKTLHVKERMSFDEQVMKLRRFRQSRVLDCLYPERDQRWAMLRERPTLSQPTRIRLTSFSFLHKPEQTLKSLADIAKLETSEAAALLDFGDQYCLDVAPYIVLAEFWDEMLPVFAGGKMDVPLQKVLAKVGLQRALRIQLNGLKELDDVWAFPLQRRRPAGTTKSSTKYLDAQAREHVSDNFCFALNDWLEGLTPAFYLTAEGVGWIKTIFGEILENAERHADGTRRDGSWSVGGFMAKRQIDPDNPAAGYEFVCHLGFVNMGDTFSESLERASPDTRARLQGYVSACRAAACSQSDDTLRTLYAIQDGVTCVEEAEMKSRGGVGLQEMLDLVNLLGQGGSAHRPRVTIVSGSSCIMLRAPYIQGARMKGDDSPRVLWCNASNSSAEPPDENYVFDLTHRLPGTVISVGFALDPEYLDGVSNG